MTLILTSWLMKACHKNNMQCNTDGWAAATVMYVLGWWLLVFFHIGNLNCSQVGWCVSWGILINQWSWFHCFPRTLSSSINHFTFSQGLTLWFRIYLLSSEAHYVHVHTPVSKWFSNHPWATWICINCFISYVFFVLPACSTTTLFYL